MSTATTPADDSLPPAYVAGCGYVHPIPAILGPHTPGPWIARTRTLPKGAKVHEVHQVARGPRHGTYLIATTTFPEDAHAIAVVPALIAAAKKARWRITNLSGAPVPFDDPLDGPVLRALDAALDALQAREPEPAYAGTTVRVGRSLDGNATLELSTSLHIVLALIPPQAEAYAKATQLAHRWNTHEAMLEVTRLALTCAVAMTRTGEFPPSVAPADLYTAAVEAIALVEGEDPANVEAAAQAREPLRTFKVTMQYPYTKWYEKKIEVEATDEVAAKAAAFKWEREEADYGSWNEVGDGDSGETEITEVEDLGEVEIATDDERSNGPR